MKKIIGIGLMILWLSLTSEVFAQSFDIGVVGGVNRVWLRGNSFVEQTNGKSYNYVAGASVQYNFPKIFSVYTGVMNELKGSGDNEIRVLDYNGVELGKAKVKTNLAYMIVPVMAKFSFGRKVKLVLGCGGYGGYLLGASTKYTGVGQPDNRETGDWYQKWDFGVSLSAGVSVPIKERLSLALEVRNNTGLYDIGTDKIYGSAPVKTNSANFLLGLGYRLGKS